MDEPNSTSVRPSGAADRPRGGALLPHLVAFAVCAVWGSTFVSTKILIACGLSPAHIFTLRFAIAYALMAAFCHHKLRADSWKDELRMAMLGITSGSLYFLAENTALAYSTATNVSLIVCSTPVFSALLISATNKAERLTARGWAGSLIALMGMAVVVMNGHFVLHLSPRGDMLAFAACLLWAVYSLIMRGIAGRYASAFITRKTFFYGILTIMPYHLCAADVPSVSALGQTKVIFNLVFLAVVASWLCYLAWAWSIKRLGAIAATNYVYIDPVATIACAALILHERITPWFLAGSLLILSGLWIGNKKKRE